MVLHDLAAGAAALVVHRFVAVGKTVELRKNISQILRRIMQLFGEFFTSFVCIGLFLGRGH